MQQKHDQVAEKLGKMRIVTPEVLRVTKISSSPSGAILLGTLEEDHDSLVPLQRACGGTRQFHRCADASLWLCRSPCLVQD